MRLKAFRLLHHNPLLQLFVILGFWALGELIVRTFRIPLPGAVLGLAILLILLATRRISVASMRRGSQWLLSDMLLFFVPAALGVLNHPEFLGWLGVKVLVVIVVSTLVVMVVTALVVEACYRWVNKRAPNTQALKNKNGQ